MKRILSIDITRGTVMMIMALDHVRDLLHVHSVTQSPTDLATTTPVLFFTRWVTYFCAPVFVFLAGTSAYLSFQKTKDLSLSRKFLFKRGIWLIGLEFTLVNFGLFFDAGFHLLLAEVIAAIGFGFIVLSILLNLPHKTLAIMGLLVLFGHDLFTRIPLTEGSWTAKVISPFFSLSTIPLFKDHLLLVAYPPVPWLGVMLSGFGAGKLFELPQERRRKIFFYTGLAALAVFLVLRTFNLYGEPNGWSSQKSWGYSILSYLNVSKYPPSLLFCLLTLGPMFILLRVAESSPSRFTGIARIYGATPLFYFILHFFVIHLLLLIILFLQGFHWNELSFASGSFGRPKGRDSGVPLWAVYLIWPAVVAALYLPCKWFGRFKATHSAWWLSYL